MRVPKRVAYSSSILLFGNDITMVWQVYLEFILFVTDNNSDSITQTNIFSLNTMSLNLIFSIAYFDWHLCMPWYWKHGTISLVFYLTCHDTSINMVWSRALSNHINFVKCNLMTSLNNIWILIRESYINVPNKSQLINL